LNAGVPDASATLAPTLLQQSDKFIKVQMPLIPSNKSGNSPIISYNLQMDDGLGGDFSSVAGFKINSMQTEYTLSQVKRGGTYRLRYRVLNRVGWSVYSPTLYALVATKPSAPPAPKLDSATGS
jgi:hypothetical protein